MGTTFPYSSNRIANGGKNKTTSLSAGLRKFMSRCERKNEDGRRRSRRRRVEEEGEAPEQPGSTELSWLCPCRENNPAGAH